MAGARLANIQIGTDMFFNSTYQSQSSASCAGPGTAFPSYRSDQTCDPLGVNPMHVLQTYVTEYTTDRIWDGFKAEICHKDQDNHNVLL